jgi:hypothetical protein
MACSHKFLSEVHSLSLTERLHWSKFLGMALSPDSFRKQIAEAKRLLQQLEVQRAAMEKDAESLRQLIRANANFLPPEEKLMELMMISVMRAPVNITQAVHAGLILGMVDGTRLTPVQIREYAESRGFDFSTYSNPLASMHTILKRMRETTPPEVEYDEATGSYLMINPPDSMLDPGFELKVIRKAWARMQNDETLKQIATTALREVAFEIAGTGQEE